MLRIAACSLALLTLAGCEWIGREARPGLYRATIETPLGELPFALELSGEGNALAAQLVDGAARVPIERLIRRDEELELLLPGGHSTLTFTARGRRLTGTVDFGQDRTFIFRAERNVPFRFFPEASTDNADVAGRWSMTMTRAATVTELAVDLKQSHDQIAGTLHAQDVDRALTGQIRGEELRLAAFDGGIAILLVASIEADGGLKGDYWSNTEGTATLSAHRSPDTVIEAETVTTDIPLFRTY